MYREVQVIRFCSGCNLHTCVGFTIVVVAPRRIRIRAIYMDQSNNNRIEIYNYDQRCAPSSGRRYTPLRDDRFMEIVVEPFLSSDCHMWDNVGSDYLESVWSRKIILPKASIPNIEIAHFWLPQCVGWNGSREEASYNIQFLSFPFMLPWSFFRHDRWCYCV